MYSRCKRFAWPFLQTNYINDLIERDVRKEDIPTVAEPSALFRSAGKSSDEILLISWRQGKHDLVFHGGSLVSPLKLYFCRLCRRNCRREKKLKERNNCQQFFVQPSAIKKVGSINALGINFLSDFDNPLKFFPVRQVILNIFFNKFYSPKTKCCFVSYKFLMSYELRYLVNLAYVFI